MDALAFIAKPPAKIGPLYVLHGDELFLKGQALRALRDRALGPDADDAVSTYPGDKADFASVFDELSTVGFFHPRRLVIVDAADTFVTRYRAALEKRVGAMPATGCLVLDVKTWAANTRLAKLVDATATLVCKAPPTHRLPQWCVDWAAQHHEKQLSPQAAALLVDFVGSEMGLLDQEIQKLAVYVGARARIEPEDVDRLVGQSRAESTWKIFDLIAAGQAGEAVAFLDRLLDQGEEPLRIVGAFSSQLRKLAQAYRLVQGGSPMAAALDQAGVPPFGQRGAEQQMKHLGRRRLARLHDWLLELNRDLRGGSALSPRTLLERLLIRLARKAEAAKAS